MIYWFLALSTFYLGIHLTRTNFMEIEWFSRSGCLVVILGVWSSMGVIFKEKLIVQKVSWKRNQAFAKSKFKLLKSKHRPAINESEIDEINDEHDKELTEQLQHLKMSIGALEVSLLISGTFVWGFGDLLMLLTK